MGMHGLVDNRVLFHQLLGFPAMFLMCCRAGGARNVYGNLFLLYSKNELHQEQIYPFWKTLYHNWERIVSDFSARLVVFRRVVIITFCALDIF